MPVLQVGGHIPLDHHLAGGAGALVAGDPHEVHLAGGLDLAYHVRVEYHHALEHPDDDGILSGVVLGQLAAQLLNAGAKLFLGDKNLLNILFHFLSTPPGRLYLDEFFL